MYCHLPQSIAYQAPDASGGASQGAPAGSSASAAPTGAPAVTPEIAALITGAVKAELAPVLAQRDQFAAERDALKSRVEAMEKEKVGNVAAKASADQEIAAIKARMSATASQAAISSAADRVQFAGIEHRRQALIAFAAQHKIECRDNNDVVASDGSKTQPLGDAFAVWIASPAGAIYKAAAAQPGAGAPASATPESAARKAVKDMSREEFDEFMRSGTCKGKLTNDPHAPVITIRRNSMPRIEAQRARLLGVLNGATPK